MAYVRKRGKQLVIVQGVRDAETNKVRQQILFTIYSKAEALRILGRGKENHDQHFRYLVEEQFPEITFNWKKIEASIQADMHVLPDLYEYRETRLRSQFRRDLCAFARQLMLAEPQDFAASSTLVREHAAELGFLADLIHWRLEFQKVEPNEFNRDNPFYWRFTLQGPGVPFDIEEQVQAVYEAGEYDRAKILFQFLVDCFDRYAEGYNYLGLISLQQEKLEEAVGHFQKTIEVGRKLFPRRIATSRYWADISTRPYMRGMMNLVIALNRAGRYEEALSWCERLEKECGIRSSFAAHRAAVYLNMGRWYEAADAALRNQARDPSESLTAAFGFHELGRPDDALAFLLHGAFNYPRAAHMLAGLRSAPPRNQAEASDHNAGIDMGRNLAGYLRTRGRKSRGFFKRVLADPAVAALMEELSRVVEAWHQQHKTGERKAFDRMRQMKTMEFARQEALKLAGSFGWK